MSIRARGAAIPFAPLRLTGQHIPARRFALLALASTALSLPATAAPLVLVGDYIKVGVSDNGTLGSNGNVSPGILFDGTGTRTFNTAYDYLTPGTPLDGFSISGTAGAGVSFTAKYNNAPGGSYNNGSGGTLTGYNGAPYNGATYDQRAVWTGTYGSTLTITNDYHFNTGSQAVSVSTTIAALTDLTNLKLARFVDPDVRAAAGDSSSTNNFRGATGVAATDLAYGVATASGYVLGLYTNDATTHNATITNWSTTPADYLTGANIGNGDYVIGLGFNLGSLLTGQSITVNYAYIFGTDISAAINSATGGGGGGGSSPPKVITGPVAFDPGQVRAGTVLPTFDGGTLTTAVDDTLAYDMTVRASGGTVDTGGHQLTLAGALSGPGVLTKTGAGTLTLTGTNSQGGLNITGGVVAIAADAALGSNTGVVALSHGGALKTTADMTLAHGLKIDLGDTGAFDTAGHNVVLSGGVAGGGGFQKLGLGGLTLAGINSFAALDIQAGSVKAGGPTALGLAGGLITLHANTSFISSASQTITQNVAVVGDNARFDTGAQNVGLSGLITGSSCFNKYGSGRLSLTGVGANAIGACVKEGALAFNGAFTGAVFIDFGATAGGGGVITGDVTANGVLAPGNSPGRLVVAGRVTQSSTSVLALDIDGPTPGTGAGHYDTLVLTGGTGVYTAGGTIAPITRGISGDATNSYTPKVGDRYQVVTAEAGVAGSFAAISQPTSGMPANTRFDVLYQPNAVVLVVTPDRYATLLAGGPLNAQAVGMVADRLRGPAGPRAATPTALFEAGLVGLNADQLGLALHQASGEIHADGTDAVLRNNRAGRGMVFDHLDQTLEGDRRLWAQLGGDSWRVQADAHASGYHTDRIAVVVGLDEQLGERLRVGGAVSYGETKLGADLMGYGRSFSYGGYAYAGWRSGAYYVNGVVAGGADIYKANRVLDLSSGRTRYAAKLDGTSWSGDVEGGRRFAIGPAALTLAAGLSTDRVQRDGGDEIGDTVGQLHLADETRDVGQARLGVRVAGLTRFGALTLRPYASAFAIQDLGDAAAETDAQLHGQAFTTSAANPGRTGGRLAAGLDAALTDHARLSLGYRYGTTERSDSQSVQARMSLTW